MSDDAFLDLHPDDERWGHGDAPGADGGRIHYVRRGSGPPVVLLHGWPGLWYDWRRVMPLLEADADLVAPDLRGFGRSDIPDGPPEMVANPIAMAADIAALADALELEGLILAGHDIGAGVAQAFALGMPDRVRALVLLNPPYLGIGRRAREYAAQREYWYQHLNALPWSHELVGASRETVRIYLSHFYDHWVGVGGSVRERELEAIVDAYAAPGRIEASFGLYRSGILEATSEDPGDTEPLAIHVPTTVLWGDADPVLPSAWADRIPEFFPTSTVRILPGVGHFVPFEAPDDVADALRRAMR